MSTTNLGSNEQLDLESPKMTFFGFEALRIVRLIFWLVALILGAAQTWMARHEILSDGISYIEIAQAYLRHDWNNALNAYWSPLFSWLIAGSYAVLRPSMYWQVATVHLVLLLCFYASLFSFEYFMRQLGAILYRERNRSYAPVSELTLYICAYSAVLWGGLNLVGVWYLSPDMIAFALTFAVMGLLLHLSRRPASTALVAWLAIASALFYLARTAFAPSIAVCLAVALVILYRNRRPLGTPALLFLAISGILCLPFAAAISSKTGRFTIGESGRLNYGWEVDGADRLIDWQGKPFDIGKPLHPTKQVSNNPKAFVFPEPVGGTYPPWYDPSYWYAGIQPKLKPVALARVVFINTTVAINYLVRSPIFIPAVIVALFAGLSPWLTAEFELWPALVPTLFGIALYCLVYFEKRYIAANLVILWIATVAGIRFRNFKLARMGNGFLITCALLFVSALFLRKEVSPVRTALRDLIHHRESSPSIDSLLAERLAGLGLHPGDRIAYMGPGMNANCARLAGLKIVAEIPLMYGRRRTLFNNTLVDDITQIKGFWEADENKKQQIYAAFRAVGAKVILTDGYFGSNFAGAWPRVLPENDDRIPRFDPANYSQINTRYFQLDSSSEK